MSSEQVELPILQVLEELLIIKRKYKAQENRIWVKNGLSVEINLVHLIHF